MAAMVPSGVATPHYLGINNHHHRSQFLPIDLTNYHLPSPSRSFFHRYHHQNLVKPHFPSFPTKRGRINAAINNPAAAGAAATSPSETASHPQLSVTLQDDYSIDDIVNNVQEHSCLFPKELLSTEDQHLQSLTLSGTGVQLGMDATWTLSIRSDGAFREHVTSPFVSFSSGFNANFDNNSTAWDIDSSGVCHRLQLDDHQATVLVAWIRTGVWSLPRPRSFLTIERVLEENSNNTTVDNNNSSNNFIILSVRLQSGRVAVHVKINTSTWQPEDAKVIMCGDYETWKFDNWKSWSIKIAKKEEEEDIGRKEEQGGVDDGNVNVTNGATKFSSVIIPHPERYTHHSMNGGHQSLTITNIQMTPTTPSLSPPELLPSNSTQSTRESLPSTNATSENTSDTTTCYYSIPSSHSGSGALLPLDSQFLKNIPSAVPVWHTRSGHMLAFATLNGDELNSGYFIVDTGASGFVIEPSAADKLNLESFGEVHVTGMAGKIKGKFRRAGRFQIGPLEVKDAVMMEMMCGGLVTGAPGPVIGIVGFDVFRRAVVDIPPMLPPKPTAAEEEKERAAIMSPAAALAFAAMNKNKNKNTSVTTTSKPHAHIHIHHPEEFETDTMLRSMLRPEDWLPVTMLSCLPHIPVTIIQSKSTQLSSSSENNENNDSNTTITTDKALLMVDTGAGGMAAMLNPSAAKTLGLFDNDDSSGSKSKCIRGVGGSHNASVTLKIAQLGLLKVGTAEFEGVQCLIAGEAKGGVALSFYSSGILCGDILSQCRLVIDLPRGRMAVLPATYLSSSDT